MWRNFTQFTVFYPNTEASTYLHPIYQNPPPLNTPATSYLTNLLHYLLPPPTYPPPHLATPLSPAATYLPPTPLHTPTPIYPSPSIYTPPTYLLPSATPPPTNNNPHPQHVHLLFSKLYSSGIFLFNVSDICRRAVLFL